MESIEIHINYLEKISQFCLKLKEFFSPIDNKQKSKNDLINLMKNNEEFKKTISQKIYISEIINVTLKNLDKLNKVIEGNNEKDILNIMISSDNIENYKNSVSTKELLRKSMQYNMSIEKSILEMVGNCVSDIDFTEDQDAMMILKDGKYIPTKYLCKGSIGKVYKGVSKNDNKEYALKIIKLRTDVKQKFFTIEQRAYLSWKDHKLDKNKMFVLEYKEELSLSSLYKCLVLELADESLEDLLKREYPNGMPELIAFLFFEQIFRGLKFIHSQDVIHRDLKPQNILLKNKIVKICDFNVCRFMDEENPYLTKVGSLPYIAPELIENIDIDRNYWHKIDVFSLGVILYRMLYGKIPFDYKSSVSVGYGQNIEVENLNYNGKDISIEAINFIKMCLIKDCKERISIDNMRENEWFKLTASKFKEYVENNCLRGYDKIYDFIKSIQTKK
jgi:hypothetical protein